MHVTLDTNIFGPLISPADYPNHAAATDLAAIAHSIAQGTIGASISQASLSLEALDRHTRVDKFFREWATKTSGITLPRPAGVRAAIFQRAFASGLTALHVPRLALAHFVDVPASAWAPDTRHSQLNRHGRSCQFMRDYPEAGPRQLKTLGAELVALHAIDCSRVLWSPGWPAREEFLWLKGIVAEYDRPRKFASTEVFSRHLRDLIAEWTDIDILASHYGYGLDLFCTLDTGRNRGTGGVLHANNRPHLQSRYGIEIVSPEDLLERLPSTPRASGPR
ncbi:MAG TPA: hypothetical protein VHG32_07765 [Thermoanaerobaculia bacterium]|jgi:hypothetical protein|nr:hypothetical protein [Thermoanaerobaculia bacterium]